MTPQRNDGLRANTDSRDAPPRVCGLRSASLREGGRRWLSLRALDDLGAPDLEAALDDVLWGAGTSDPHSALRWEPDAPSRHLPALSVAERARLHVSLGEGVSLAPLAGRTTSLSLRGDAMLWTLDAHLGAVQVEVRLGERVLRRALRVRARWDESAAALDAVVRELSEARWSAAVRGDASGFEVAAALRSGGARDPSELRYALGAIARSPALLDAVRHVARAPEHVLSAELTTLSCDDPIAQELYARRGDTPDPHERGARALVRRPVDSLDAPENRLVRAVLDALVARSRALGEVGFELVARFETLRREVPWIDAVRPGPLDGSPPRRARFLPFAQLAALLLAPRPTLSNEASSQASLFDLPTLYERWCALEVALALGASNEQALRLLDGGTLELAAPGLALRIDAQRSFAGSALMAFRPDLTVSSGARMLHLDAKYRLDPAREGASLARDELVKMHAYRDAIGGTVGAYALFPGASEERVDGRDARGGVGAIPLRAGLDRGAREAQREALRALALGLLG